jgi:1,6-anhydro-N-acetylmuramate kinase
VTDTEAAQASADGRETPAMDPALWAQLKAEQTARLQAEREAEAEQLARLTPVTDAELERYRTSAEAEGAGASAQRAAALEEIRAEVDTISAKVDKLPDPAAERRAEMDQAGIDEPVVHEPQAEPALEASWQPGDAQGYQEPDATADAGADFEIEM